MYRIILSGLLFTILILAGCTQGGPNDQFGVAKTVTVDGGSYTDVNVPELETMLAEKDFTFINVHIPFEGDIAATDLSIPYNTIEQNLSQIPGDKDAKIVLYCRSDRMSRIAAERLVELGYTNVWNLEGGMVAWQNAGNPLDLD
ncbi:MAG: rhodanese-like domain-containing protein [Anaerolineales bacterium]